MLRPGFHWPLANRVHAAVRATTHRPIAPQTADVSIEPPKFSFSPYTGRWLLTSSKAAQRLADELQAEPGAGFAAAKPMTGFRSADPSACYAAFVFPVDLSSQRGGGREGRAVPVLGLGGLLG